MVYFCLRGFMIATGAVITYVRANEWASELLGGGAVSCWVYRLRAAAAAVSNAVIPGSESLNTLGRNMAAERARTQEENEWVAAVAAAATLGRINIYSIEWWSLLAHYHS